MERIFKLDGVPVVYVISYMPAGLVEDFGSVSIEALEEAPVYLLVEHKYNMPTLSTRERFAAVAADADTAAKLELAENDPVLRIHMLAFTTRNVLYEYRVSYCNTSYRQIYRD